ncbi:hypothetical protein LCGC14_2328580 [marine sediment metagenome]|uniref:Uncharacterized protein n=1 Tax=marine sediment metagenome TaxID=412755 RepID=A0A0F9CG82_9ZZZZ
MASKEAHLHNYPSVREGVLALYKEDRKDFKYQTDLETFGISEEWLFPFQTMKLIELGIPVDCEDRSHLLASRLITAGLPPFRVRTACGTIWTGKGHSTIQFLDDDLTTWRHLNSTSPLDWVNPRMGKTLNEVETMDEMPTTNDRKDVIGLGIKNYWFSFTNYASWNKFENKTSANTFKKEQKKGGLKYIEIKQ